MERTDFEALIERTERVKSTGFFQLHSRKRAARVVKDITDNVVFPGETMILNVDANLYKFARKMRHVTRSKLM